MRSPPRVATAVVALSVLCLAVVALAAGAPPPSPICGVCGSDTLDGATEPGTLDIYVDESGDSQWVAQVPVNETAAAHYQTDEHALATTVDDSQNRYRAVDDEAQNVTATIDDQTVRVEYTVPNVARQGVVGDGWVLEYFYAGDSPVRYELVAERVSIHLPDDYTVTNSPAAGSIENGTLTWVSGGSGEDEEAAGDDFPSRTYVTYAQSGLTNTAASWTAAAVAFGPVVLEHTVLAGVVPVVIVGFAAVATSTVGAGRSRELAGRSRWVGTVGRTGCVALCRRLGVHHSRRTLTLLGVVAVGLLAGTGWLAGFLFEALLIGAFGLSVVLFLPFGHALARGERSAWLYGVACLLAPLGAVAALAPFPTSGTIYVLSLIVFLPTAGGTAVLGYALSLVGREIALEGDGKQRETQHRQTSADGRPRP
ncbi:uncharacterized protein Nmag_2310 [Natrialba magadii ATCC 43099]|uniref:Uncharacterized protein n=1 Tax=Natrialba magadii (strain ATCC 43099 / DSM 3394 / CCM 3739 / CIP 104546 / IAM 13178 / JCM 8861 / NBRC 102185 / NCIMB 2190 / MS3) TaxID=547559 RepID=D3SWZ1_NATMM|nr:hypothetical protein [Natrialba magadii]ADD05873.1 uncharacterized protein Nmag_2310 [Natrialba magadii ATCC 43099]ELY30619.1 hypothetical protein C500_08867 [Natrialba magadii ATCC 43099]